MCSTRLPLYHFWTTVYMPRGTPCTTLYLAVTYIKHTIYCCRSTYKHHHYYDTHSLVIYCLNNLLLSPCDFRHNFEYFLNNNVPKLKAI